MKFLAKGFGVSLALVAGLVLAGVMKPDLPGLGPAVSALRRGDLSRALGAAAPSLAPKRTYWRYVDAQGSLKIVASADEIPAAQRIDATPIEVEITPLPTRANGVDARAAMASSGAENPASRESASGGTPAASPVTTYRNRALGAGRP